MSWSHTGRLVDYHFRQCRLKDYEKATKKPKRISHTLSAHTIENGNVRLNYDDYRVVKSASLKCGLIYLIILLNKIHFYQ